jgi:glucosamine--fructose-6-phosphate aminotransferase (isomerizing)
VLGLLDASLSAAQGAGDPAVRLVEAAELAEQADRALRGVPGVQTLLASEALAATIVAKARALEACANEVEHQLDAEDDGAAELLDVEAVNAAIVRARDVAWALRRDRVGGADAVASLVGRSAVPSLVAAGWAIQVTLASLDRLEVRGRDSAGVHVLVRGHGLDMSSEPYASLLAPRQGDPLFCSGSVRAVDGCLAFVYKAAAEIGELGDNTRALRTAIAGDELLRLALSSPSAEVTLLAHTRWASVGIISEANAHPLNEEEEPPDSGVPYVAAALNGDVYNHADLKAEYGLRIAAPITTDAKVIPALVSRHTVASGDLAEAFRRTVASFEGSVAIGAVSTAAPDQVLLALQGSGQALYVGVTEDAYIVASEPYGLVEETSTYLRLDGEVPSRPEAEDASRGQIVVLESATAGQPDGIRRLGYDGTPLPVRNGELVEAVITTRDIDRGSYPHFLLKEISESPSSFRKTLRGRVRETGGRLHTVLGEATIPPLVGSRLASGQIKRVVVIGQGTAAVAGRSAAALLAELTAGSGLTIDHMTATELSGFGLAVDLSDTLVIAVSQSGTTTDTNRTVDLVRQRGGAVIAIVNRRGSDLTDRSDGVLYTSDGRDVEMSVASTKAFYSQVAAGALLACAIAEHVGGDAVARHDLLVSLRDLPRAMSEVLGNREAIAEAARALAPARRYWAVVGNGPNKVAAEEVRIKLSELCYKSIACDVTEDKKHIDLSSEPLILVCAAGLSGGTADDVAKEVAIYRAHKAAPIVVATEGEGRFQAALRVIGVPAVTPSLAFVLSAMAGHLFGYEAALAIDALARPLREARQAVEEAVGSGWRDDEVLRQVRSFISQPARRFADGLRSGVYDGNLEASTAVRVTTLLRIVTSPLPLDVYQAEQGKVATPQVLLDDLTTALTRAIDELTRPIDAIKHQAKTVTVGISRSDEGLVTNRLVREVLAAGAGRDRLSYRSLKVLVALDAAVDGVTGYTRYRIEGDPSSRGATIEIVDRGGLGRELRSRVETNPELRGTKRRISIEGRVHVARGRADGRTVILVPERKGDLTVGITLLHVRFRDRLAADAARSVLQGYYDRYALLHDTVSETEPVFRDDLLATIDLVDLLTVPVFDLADRWRATTSPR